MLRFLIDLILLILSPLLIIAWLIATRFLTRARHRDGVLEKLFGPPQRESDSPLIWIHAVSVGEVRTSIPLLKDLRDSYPDWQIALSTSTDTGYKVASQLKESSHSDLILFYAPFDLSFSVSRTIKALKPRAILLVELELWPNFLLTAKKHEVPVYVVNGRLSANSAKNYQALSFLSKPLFSWITAYAVQDEAYKKRFLSLGVPSERIAVLGNLKYDVPVPELPLAEDPRKILGGFDGPILMGGCTHPGEEKSLLAAFENLRKEYSGLRLILAPRHIERAGEVRQLSEQALGEGSVQLWSQIPTESTADDLRVLVIDQIGLLDRFYALADIVFLGGSLIPHGGHNILEPARFAKPILIGPHYHNFSEIVEHFLESNAVTQVENSEILESKLAEWLGDAQLVSLQGNKAKSACDDLGGAVESHMKWLEEHILERN